jgi:hypothetical protein
MRTGIEQLAMTSTILLYVANKVALDAIHSNRGHLLQLRYDDAAISISFPAFEFE